VCELDGPRIIGPMTSLKIPGLFSIIYPLCKYFLYIIRQVTDFFLFRWINQFFSSILRDDLMDM